MQRLHESLLIDALIFFSILQVVLHCIMVFCNYVMFTYCTTLPAQVGMVRDLQFVSPLKMKMGPPQTLCIQAQRYQVYSGDHLVFQTSQVRGWEYSMHLGMVYIRLRCSSTRCVQTGTTWCLGQRGSAGEWSGLLLTLAAPQGP